MVSSTVNDLSYALRQMRLAPVLTITIVLTLGLGIGATTAIFSLVHAVRLRPLPVIDPQGLFCIGTGKTCCYSTNPQGEWGIFSYDFYQRLRKSTPQFDQIAAFQAEPNILDQPAAPMVFGTLAQRIHYTDPAMQDDERWSRFITGAQVWSAADAAGKTRGFRRTVGSVTNRLSTSTQRH
jgi:hypothetical protein